MPHSRDVTLQDLLAQGTWVRALARRLVRDTDEAEDIEQETWVSTLERPPGDGRNLRAWFARVVRRRRLDARRADGRRLVRERSARPREDAPTPDEVLVRAEVRARVAEEVLRLEEPYRSTVLLRFVEGLPLHEVARLQGAPVATVRTRIHRAVADLRRRLAGPSGDARLALAPLFGAWPSAAACVSTEVLMAATKTKVWAGAVALVLAGATTWMVVESLPPTSEPATSEVASAGASTSDERAASPTLEAAPRAEAVEAGSAASPDPGVEWTVREGSTAEPGTISGVVKDERGRPRDRVSAILLEQGDPTKQRLVATDAEGRFRFDGLAEGTHPLRLLWGRAEWRGTIRAGANAIEVVLRHDLPLSEGVRRARGAPAGVLGGTVRDREGSPMVDVEVRLFEEAGRTPLRTAVTDANGGFGFEGLDDAVHWLGFLTPRASYLATPARPGQWLEVTLPTRARIAGVVVDEETGAAIAGIDVTVHSPEKPQASQQRPTREDGAFSFDVGDGPWHVTVGNRNRLVVPGSETVADEFLLESLEPVAAGTTDLRIRIRRGAVIEGELRGPDGARWTSLAEVRATPYTPEGKIDWSHVKLTRVKDGMFRIAGLPLEVPHDITVTVPEGSSPDAPPVFGLVHDVAAGPRRVIVDLRPGRPVVIALTDEGGNLLRLDGGWIQIRPWGSEPGGADSVWASTPREDGRFVSPPLDPAQVYMVVTGHFRGYVGGQATRVNAGDTEVTVVLAGASFSGRVVDAKGSPVRGTVLQAWAIGADVPTHAFTVTDDEGRFHLPGAPKGPVRVHLVPTSGTRVDLGEHTTPAADVTLRLP